jgi:hypothetical protein
MRRNSEYRIQNKDEDKDEKELQRRCGLRHSVFFIPPSVLPLPCYRLVASKVFP